jgi:hypothetical protein
VHNYPLKKHWPSASATTESKYLGKRISKRQERVPWLK